MWAEPARTTPRSPAPAPDFSKTIPYLEPSPANHLTDYARPPATPPRPWPAQSPLAQPAPVWAPSPLSPPAYGVADALRQRTRWWLWIPVGLLAMLVGAAAALPFLPRVPPAVRPIRDAIVGLTGLGTGNTEVAATPEPEPAAAPDHPAHGPRIVPLPAPAPVMAAPPADPRLNRRAALAAARAAGARRLRSPFLRSRAPVALAPAPKRTVADPFDDAAHPAPARTAEPPAEPPPAPAAPVARETAPPAPAPPPRPAAEKPPAGSLDELMANAVSTPPPKGKSELDRRLAGIDESRDDRAAAAQKQEAAPAHSLTRSEIQAAMKSLQPKVNECARQFQSSGAAELKVTVAPDGSVKGVNVLGVFAGTPTAECLERAVKTAAFPPSNGLRFDYPLALK
jgi:outer membrane biosynthesis protein TonB